VYASRFCLMAGILFAVRCHDGSSPVGPSTGKPDLTGTWRGALLDANSALYDFSNVTLTLQQSGSGVNGQLQAASGPTGVVSGMVGSSAANQDGLAIDLTSLGNVFCQSLGLSHLQYEIDSGGTTRAFSGGVVGRCGPDIVNTPFRLVRPP
jgi:hypothetical protein